MINLKNALLLKRLRLGKTPGWQHRFFDLIILSPIRLGTYEYMKSTLENFFFRFETGLPEWIFQIWSKIFKSDPVFVYMKKSIFWAFLGPAKVSMPLVITKFHARSEKTPKKLNWPLWPAQNAQNELLAGYRAQSQYFLILLAEPRKTNFCSSETKP